MAFDPFSIAMDIGGKLIDRLWPNPEDKAKAQLALLQLQQQGELQPILAQLEVDKAEAASNSVFVAGWRPAVGWICGLGIATDVVIRPIVLLLCAVFNHPIVFPALDLSTLMPLLLGMLGLGAMRSWDKVNGNANGH